jgi:hypothetical protein
VYINQREENLRLLMLAGETDIQHQAR